MTQLTMLLLCHCFLSNNEGKVARNAGMERMAKVCIRENFMYCYFSSRHPYVHYKIFNDNSKKLNAERMMDVKEYEMRLP